MVFWLDWNFLVYVFIKPSVVIMVSFRLVHLKIFKGGYGY